jgi:hypothetical protein
MAFEVHGTESAGVALYPQPGTGPGNAIAQLRFHTRVFVRSQQPGWAKVRLLGGEHAGAEGWVQAGTVTPMSVGTVADDEEMEQLFDTMRTAEFVPPGGQATPIPYRYPKDGCFARAAVMAALLSKAGYTVNKEFAISAGGLQMRTAHGGDQLDYGLPLQVNWWYHVAPIVYAEMGGPKPVPFVLDPSTADNPLSVGDWAANFAQQPVDEEMDYDALRKLLASTKAYPVGRTLLVRSGPVVYSPPLATDPTQLVSAPPQHPEQVLAQTAANVPAHDVVAGLDAFFRTCLDAMHAGGRDSRQPYSAYLTDLNRVRGSVQALPKQPRTYIVSSFPNFLQDWRNTFDSTGIKTDIGQLLGLLTA